MLICIPMEFGKEIGSKPFVSPFRMNTECIHYIDGRMWYGRRIEISEKMVTNGCEGIVCVLMI